MKILKILQPATGFPIGKSFIMAERDSDIHFLTKILSGFKLSGFTLHVPFILDDTISELLTVDRNEPSAIPIRYVDEGELKPLTAENLEPIGPGNTNSWRGFKTLYLPEKARQKYNSPICTEVRLLPSGIESFRMAYRTVRGLPIFVHLILQGRASAAREKLIYAPQLFRIFDSPGSAKTLLILNADYFNHEDFIHQCKTIPPSVVLKSLKESSKGLALVGWYLHPNLLPKDVLTKPHFFDQMSKTVKHNAIECRRIECDPGIEDSLYYRYGSPRVRPMSGSFSLGPRSPTQQATAEIEKASEPYLACLLDLDLNPCQSLSYLISLRTQVLKYIQDIFGVTTKDKIKLYYHLPYLEVTSTLHLHIRVNQADHAIEDSKSFGINEIITQLESGRSVGQLIMERGPMYTAKFPIGEGLLGVLVREIPNPRIG